MVPLVVIPARLGSRRLPRKPLAMIGELPLIVQVLRRAQEADVGPVVVACAEREVADVVADAGGEAIMTAPEAPSGSDRACWAASCYDPQHRYDVVINLQGDLPTIAPATLRAALAPLANPAVDVATVVAAIDDRRDVANPNVVKAITGLSNHPAAAQTARALYFTRAAAPAGEGPMWRHIGVYAYRRPALERFAAAPPSVLEIRERLEQLRALEEGLRVECARVDVAPACVDVPEDLEKVRMILSAR